MLQRFDQSGMILRFFLPQANCITGPCIGIRKIEHIVQAWMGAAGIHQCNSFGIFIDPALHFLIPERHVCTGGCVRLLGIDQHLVSEAILVVVGCGLQKRQPVLIRSREVQQLCIKDMFDGFLFGCHTSTSLFA